VSKIVIDVSMYTKNDEKVPGIIVHLKEHSANEEMLRELMLVLNKQFDITKDDLYDVFTNTSEKFVKDIENE